MHGYSSVVFVACFVSSGLCDELITGMEESSWVCLSNFVLSRIFKNEVSFTVTVPVA